MTDEKKIDVSILNSGHWVIKLKIIDEFKKLLIDEGKKTTKDFRDKLAGILDNEKGYDEEAKK